MSENAPSGFESQGPTLNRIPTEAKNMLTLAATVSVEQLGDESRAHVRKRGRQVLESFGAEFDAIAGDALSDQQMPASDGTVTVNRDTAEINTIVWIDELSPEQKLDVADRAREAEDAFMATVSELRNGGRTDDCDCDGLGDRLPCWSCFGDD